MFYTWLNVSRDLSFPPLFSFSPTSFSLLKHMQKKHWYVLNFIPVSLSASRKKAEDWINRFNGLNSSDLEIFAPTFFVYSDKKEKKGLRQIPLTYHYVFIRGDHDEVKKLCLSGYGFYFVLTTKDETIKEHAIVPDEAMNSFMLIARRYSNSLPFYPLENVVLEDGDYVRIVEGDFAGLEGYFFPKAKSSKGRVVLRIAKELGTAVFDISAKYIQILRFSPQSNVKYHIVERFIPRFFPILRKYFLHERLSEEEITEISLFTRRMGVVRMDKPITEAKLSVLLVGCYRIMGNVKEENQIRQRLGKELKHLESPSVKAMVDLILAVIDRDPERLMQGLELLNESESRSSELKSLLNSEFDFYISMSAIPNVTE